MSAGAGAGAGAVTGTDGPRLALVVGTGRCGSTLVHELLARHPGTGFVHNLDDLGLVRSRGWHNAAWRRLPPEVSQKGRVRFAPSEAYRLLAREVSPALVDPVRDLTADDATPWLADRLRGLVTDRHRSLGAPLLLHKLTGWPRTGLFHACLPRTTVVEVVRDGRAVATSWTQMSWWGGHRGTSVFGPLPPDLVPTLQQHRGDLAVHAALDWRRLREAHDAARAAAPAGTWLRVRYEDLLAAPHEVLHDVVRHLGLDPIDDFERAVDRYRLSTQRVQSFRRDLSSRGAAALDAVLAPQLDALGYG